MVGVLAAQRELEVHRAAGREHLVNQADTLLTGQLEDCMEVGTIGRRADLLADHEILAVLLGELGHVGQVAVRVVVHRGDAI